MEPDALPAELEDILDRLQALVAGFEEEPDGAVQARVFELLRAVDILHRAGLRRIDELLRAAGLQARALDDPEVKLLFDLYDLGEGGDIQRVEAVLTGVAPYVESHGGRLSVIDAAGGVVTVSLSGACSSCPGSTSTLRHVVEAALRDGLPDFVRMEVVETPDASGGGHGHVHGQGAGAGAEAGVAPAGFIPLESLRPPARPALEWRRVFDAVELEPGRLRVVEVSADGPILVANVDGEFHAYRDGCPGSPLTLGGATIEGNVLVCPWHACRFDLRGGRRISAEGPSLVVVPIAVQAGEVRIGSLVGAAA
ncbi:MAG TPA: NifU family protein [Candidatus Limnocylindrales bacterium]|nr:NifU family protein [Candidatus Limnocylindrales bacterium]